MSINLELVKRRAGDPEGLKDRAGVVESELHRVHGLIDSLLRLVRPWPDTDHVNVDAVFAALLPALRARAGLHRIGYTHEAGAGIVAMPPADLVQVVANLADNAIDAVARGGHLRTRCEGGKGGARIAFIDDGPGMPELEDPFAAGATGREDRSGLGLAVAHRLVRQAGGSIAIGPNPEGPGTTVVVDLPRPGTT
jgi:signal transduction histidine kinase